MDIGGGEDRVRCVERESHFNAINCSLLKNPYILSYFSVIVTTRWTTIDFFVAYSFLCETHIESFAYFSSVPFIHILVYI